MVRSAKDTAMTGDKTLERKLAAVLYADVAGYSRLTGADEEGTHRRLSSYLDLITEAITSGGGRVVHYAGDAVLADFATVTTALNAATDIQQKLWNLRKSHSSCGQFKTVSSANY